MTLASRQLNGLDAVLLDLLYDGRVTPLSAQTLLSERSVAEGSRQYTNRRLGRLAEHGHARNIEGSGVYELVDDPRPVSDDLAIEQFKRLSEALDTPITVGETVYETGDRHPVADGVEDDDP
ncbi:hypothetical protein [Halocatena salina]|uniref:Uncharacterized protein n=1 Tax=Halocatena salina TaxID=2934340 RepID=A0A8U0A9V8_9EURY|nr:hypothetical protein [Halocatena salina]UPM44743.1 hypothetical protein MW046_17085 [Halocatena salina]